MNKLLNKARRIYKKNKNSKYMPYIDVFPTQQILDAYSEINVKCESFDIDNLTIHIIFYNLYAIEFKKNVVHSKIIDVYSYEQTYHGIIDSLVECTNPKYRSYQISFNLNDINFYSTIKQKYLYVNKNPYLYVLRYILDRDITIDFDLSIEWIYSNKHFYVENVYKKIDGVYVFNTLFYLISLCFKVPKNSIHSLYKDYNRARINYLGNNLFIKKYLQCVRFNVDFSTKLGNIIYQKLEIGHPMNINRILYSINSKYECSDRLNRYRYALLFCKVKNIELNNILPENIQLEGTETYDIPNGYEEEYIERSCNTYYFDFIDINFAIRKQRIYDRDYSIETKFKCDICLQYKKSIVVHYCCFYKICSTCSNMHYLNTYKSSCISCNSNINLKRYIYFLYHPNSYLYLSYCFQINNLKFKRYFNESLELIKKFKDFDNMVHCKFCKKILEIYENNPLVSCKCNDVIQCQYCPYDSLGFKYIERNHICYDNVVMCPGCSIGITINGGCSDIKCIVCDQTFDYYSFNRYKIMSKHYSDEYPETYSYLKMFDRFVYLIYNYIVFSKMVI